MQINPGDGSGLFDEINDICQSDNNSYPIIAKTRRLNAALDRFYSIVYNLYNWTIDDTNQTDLDVATADLVAGQQDYPFASELLTLRGVAVKETGGEYKELEEETDPRNTFITPSGNSGTPTKFKLTGGSILLDYIPNTNVTDGIKITFTRNLERFLSTDTTKEPGIPSQFHYWLACYASLPYLIEFQKAQKNDISVLISQGEESIKYFMSNRNQTRKSRLSVKQEFDQ